MRKYGLIVLATMFITMFLISFAYAIDEVASPRKIDGVGNAWKKPEVNQAVNAPVNAVLPPGIAQRQEGDIPGQGKHLGWEKGKHLGWEKQAEVEAGVEKSLKTAIEDYRDKLKTWLGERPKFDIAAEGGVAGYREAVKNWLDKRPELDVSGIIKEIEASL